MKRTIISIVALLCMTFAMAQQKSHTIQRGETIESIAKKYNVSVYALQQANPDLQEMFYVGMKLVIPQQAHTNIHESSGERVIEDYNPFLDMEGPEKKSLANIEKEILAGVSINGYTGKDVKGSEMLIGFHTGFGIKYYFNNSFNIGIAVLFSTKGYEQEDSISSGPYWNDDGGNFNTYNKESITTYNIDLPISLGYRLSFSDGFNSSIKLGPYFTYTLFGNKKTKIINTIYPDIHSSETERTNKKEKISKLKNFNPLSIGIMAGLSFDIHNFIIAINYQHGITPLFDKEKKYEKNIMVSLGYKF